MGLDFLGKKWVGCHNKMTKCVVILLILDVLTWINILFLKFAQASGLVSISYFSKMGGGHYKIQRVKKCNFTPYLYIKTQKSNRKTTKMGSEMNSLVINQHTFFRSHAWYTSIYLSGYVFSFVHLLVFFDLKNLSSHWHGFTFLPL